MRFRSSPSGAFAVLAVVLLATVPCAGRAKTPERAEHLVPAPGGFLAPTLEGPWRSRITLNAWLPTTIKFNVDDGSESSSTTEHLNWLLRNIVYEIPTDVEVRKGSFGAYAHLLAFKLRGTIDVGRATLDWDDHGFLLDVGLSYELGRWALGTGAGAPSLTVEPFAGARLLYDPVDVDIDLGPLEDPVTIDGLSNYVPVIGLRTFWDLTERWNLRMEGDYGGFGVDDNHQTFNLLGLIGYRFRGWGVVWNIQAGYRYLRLLDLEKKGADLKIDLQGPLAVFAVEF